MGRSLPILGLPGVWGGGNPPKIVADDFTTDSGLWLDGNLLPAAITVSDGWGVWSPSDEGERHTSACATSDPNGNEANAVGPWGTGGIGTTNSVETGDVAAGSYSLKVTASSSGTNRRSSVYFTDGTRGWHIWRLAAKHLSGTWRLRNSYFNTGVLTTGAWANYIIATCKRADYHEFTVWNDVAEAGQQCLADNVSIKRLSAATVFRLRRVYYPSTITVRLRRQAFVSCGVVMYKDADNYVAVATSATNALFLFKVVDGRWLHVGDGAFTYVPGTALQLIPSADMRTWTVKYGANTIINAASITDFAPIGKWYAGLLNTYNPEDTSIVGFDDFSAVALEGAPPFMREAVSPPASATVNRTKVVATGEAPLAWLGRPVVKTLANGNTIMVYRKGTAHSSNDGQLQIRFSADYGETWTAENTDLEGNPVAGWPLFLDPSPGGGISNCWLIRREDDDKLLLLFDYVNWGTTQFYGMYQAVGSADGLTWAEPTQIVFGGIDNSLLCLAECDDFTVDGRIYTTTGRKTSPARCSVVYTDDGGDTWSLLSDIGTNMNEGGIEYVGNNTIRALIRSASNNATHAGVSTNMGASWSTFELTYRIAPIGRPHIKTRAHLQGAAEWWTDPYLIAWGFVFVGNLRRNALWLSKTAGQTWPPTIFVDGAYADAGYGDMFYNPNTDEYVYVNYRGTQTVSSIVQYNITINWND